MPSLNSGLFHSYKAHVQGDAESTITGAIDLDTDEIRAMLLIAAVDREAAGGKVFLSNVDTSPGRPNAAPIGADKVLASKTVSTDGTFDAADLTTALANAFNNATLITTGAAIGAIVIYKWGGTTATSPLICQITSWTPPITTTNGNAVEVTWNASGIHRL